MHHTPGRLRFKAPRMADNPDLADRCTRYAHSLHGVRAASLNALTGSFLVHYCPRTLDPDALVALLKAHGGFGKFDGNLIGRNERAPVAEQLGDALIEAVVAKTADLCLQALVKRLF